MSADRGFAAPLIVTSQDHLGLVSVAVSGAGVEPNLVISEPTGRNTAPAAVAAALNSDPGDVLVIVPSDHLIDDDDGFAEVAIGSAPLAEEGWLVTFGVKPTRPETGYGYIEIGEPVAGGHRVKQFTEKPGRAEAARMLEEGGHVWNSGMFVMTAGTLLAEAEAHCPSIVSGVAESMGIVDSGVLRLTTEFGDIESVSIDTAIMEKTDKAVVVPIDVGWDDIGSYESLWAALERDDSENAVSGSVVLKGVSGSLVAATSRLVAVAGLDDVVVIETEDAVLVVPRGRSQMVRDLVDRLEAGRLDPGRNEAE